MRTCFEGTKWIGLRKLSDIVIPQLYDTTTPNRLLAPNAYISVDMLKDGLEQEYKLWVQTSQYCQWESVLKAPKY